MNFGGTIRLNKLGVCIVTALIFLLLFYVVSWHQNEDKKEKVSLRKLLVASAEIAIKGGKEVIDVYKGAKMDIKSKGETKEGANDPITNADEKSHCAMYYSLCHAFPHINIASEEKSEEGDCLTSQTLELDNIIVPGADKLEDEEVPTSDVTVWIDPLDATVEYTEKLLQYVTTMVCVAVKGVPIIGVIHKPFGADPKTTWAWVGKGVSSDISDKNLVKTFDEKNLSVTISRSHSGEVEKVVKNALGESVTIIPAGGAGYKILEVASKNVSAYVHTTQIKKWDICAGNAIVNALKGQMTTLKNEKINYQSLKEVVNSDGLLVTLTKHDWFLEKLKGVNSS